MLRRGAWHAAVQLLSPRPRRLRTAVRAAAPASPRPDVADVERLTRGEAAKRRGTGSREVPHRLNASERAGWDLAKRRRFVVLSGIGYRRERKGSPLLNSWRQMADALAIPCVSVQQGGGESARLERVVVDLSPLRAGREQCAGVRDACVQLAAPLGAALIADTCEAAIAEAEAAPAGGAIWTLPAADLEFTCADRPSAKAFAEALAEALCGATPAVAAAQAKARPAQRRDAQLDDETS